MSREPFTPDLRRLGRRQVVRGGVGLVAGSAAAFLLACSGGSKEEAPTTTGGTPGTAAPAAAASGQMPKRGGRFKMHWGGATNNLNPVTNWVEGTILSGVIVYDRLISARLTKDYILEAAHSVEQPDPTTVIFTLKPGMKYHDRAPVSGRAVVADDIVKTQLFVRDNPKAADNSFQNASMQSVTAPDSQTVVFKLKAPNAYVFTASQLSTPTTQAIIPPELHDNLDTAWQIGSGPYQLAEYDLNSRYLYKRFPGYHGANQGLPYVEEREVAIINDPAGQEAAFRSEQLHIWRNPPGWSAIEPLKRDMGGKIEVDEWLPLSFWGVNANGTRPLWKDIRVREALLYRVLNRQQHVDLLEQGKGQVCPGLLSVGLTDYQLDPRQTEQYFRQDARAAKQLLDAAGFAYDKEIEMIVTQSPKNAQAAEIFQQSLAPLGVKVRIVPMPFSEWLGVRIATGNFDIFSNSNPAYDSPQVPLRLQHTNTFNVHKYNGLKDPETDALIERAEQTLDKTERIKVVKDAQLALLAKYTPFVLPYTATAYQPRWKYVRDFEISPAINAQPFYWTELWLDK